MTWLSLGTMCAETAVAVDKQRTELVREKASCGGGQEGLCVNAPLGRKVFLVVFSERIDKLTQVKRNVVREQAYLLAARRDLANSSFPRSLCIHGCQTANQCLMELAVTECAAMAGLGWLAQWPPRQRQPLMDLFLCGAANPTNMSGFTSAPRLTTLDLGGCGQLTDVTSLGRALPPPSTRLTSLDLMSLDRGHDDVKPLAPLSGLTRLGFSFCTALTDVEPVFRLGCLEELSLCSCGGLADLTPVGRLVAVQALQLLGSGALRDVSSPRTPARLETLSFCDCRNLAAANRPASLTWLSALNLKGCQRRRNIRPLANLRHLTSLDLSLCNKVTDVRCLASLPLLRQLRR